MKGMRAVWLMIVVVPAIVACSGSKAGGDKASASASTEKAGSPSTSASTNRLCSLYTAAEIKSILGISVADGDAAGPMATACQWEGTGADGGFAQVQLVPGRKYWEKHSGAVGYEVLPGIGTEAFVATSANGWEAATVTDKTVLFVTLSGGTSSRNSAVAFLKQTLEKLGPGT